MQGCLVVTKKEGDIESNKQICSLSVNMVNHTSPV
jgi:hypothetical protein